MKTNRIDGNKNSTAQILACWNAELRKKYGKHGHKKAKVLEILQNVDIEDQTYAPEVEKADETCVADSYNQEDVIEEYMNEESHQEDALETDRDPIPEAVSETSSESEPEPTVIEIPFSFVTKLLGSFLGDITKIPLESLVRIVNATEGSTDSTEDIQDEDEEPEEEGDSQHD